MKKYFKFLIFFLIIFSILKIMEYGKTFRDIPYNPHLFFQEVDYYMIDIFGVKEGEFLMVEDKNKIKSFVDYFYNLGLERRVNRAFPRDPNYKEVFFIIHAARTEPVHYMNIYPYGDNRIKISVTNKERNTDYYIYFNSDKKYNQKYILEMLLN